jgi:hypothetical protein
MYEAPQVNADLAKSMRKSLYAFVFVSVALLVLTWAYLRGYETRAAGSDVTITEAAAVDYR